MAHVFISHASADGRTAEQVRRWLATDRHDVFLAQASGDGVALGEDWQRRLYERLRWADAVVCLVSQAYWDSTWCTAELAIAHERGRRILPILVEPGPPHPLVSALQHTDYSADPDTAGAALRDALRRLDAAGGLGWPDDRSPFPGLLAFDTDMHGVFFGRRGEVDQLAALLRSPAAGTEPGLHVVVGPSGCGKSSLVRAGLLPLMADEPGWWTLPPIVPGTDPVTALARALAAEAHRTGLGWTLEHVLDRLNDLNGLGAGDPHGLNLLAEDLLLAATHGQGRRLLVVVDQLEELATLTPPDRRRHFSRLLAHSLTGSIQVVATARPEALAQLLASPELDGVPLRPYALRPLDRQMLPVVVEEPARLAGIGVDPELVVRLVADTGSGEALPLLAFTLAELVDGVPRGGELSIRRYEELGGVRGALVRQADAALVAAGTASGRPTAEVVAGLLRLVGVDENGNPTRRRVARADLPEPVRVETDAFVARRLLTADQDAAGVAVVEVAHEAVLTAWPPLAEAVGAAATALRAGRLVERAAADWNQAGRPSTRLWGGDQLAGAVVDTGAHRVRGKGLVTDRIDLTIVGRDFLTASRSRDRRRRTRLVSTLSGLLVLALVTAGIAFVQQREAQTQRREAEAQHALALSRQLAANSVALGKSRRATAEQLAAAALKVALTDEARNSAGALLADYRTTMAQPGGISASAFSPDGGTIATGSATNGQVWLWNSVTRTPQARIETGHNAISILRYSPDGKVLSTADQGTVRLWDLDTGHPRGAPLTGHSNGVGDIVFAPDGRTVMTYDSQRVGIRVWDTRTGELRTTLTLDNFEPSAMALSPDGRRLATGDGGGTVRFWNAATGQPESKPLNGQAGAIRAVSFSPNGKVLAVLGGSDDIWLRDAGTGKHLRTVGTSSAERHFYDEVAFSPDSRIIAAAGGEVGMWNTADGTPAGLPLAVQETRLSTVMFSPDGRTVVTAGRSTTGAESALFLWDSATHTSIGAVPDSGMLTTGFSPDGRLLALASVEGDIRLWQPATRTATHVLHTDGSIDVAAFSPDGSILATIGQDGTQRWSPATGEPTGPVLKPRDQMFSLAFSPDSKLLAIGEGTTVRLWDPVFGTVQRVLPQQSDTTDAVAFSPDGKLLATAAGSTTHLWNPATGSPAGPGTIATGPVGTLTFSPDGSILASAGGTVHFWNPSTGKPLASPASDLTEAVAVAFSPDGRTLATSEIDGTIRLWNVATRKALGAPIAGHNEPISGLAFSPDGKLLAGIGRTTAGLWETAPYLDPVGSLCAQVGGISRADWTTFAPGEPWVNVC